MRDPRHRHEPCPVVHRPREIVARDAAVAVFRRSAARFRASPPDAGTARTTCCSAARRRRRCRRLQIESRGDDVLAFAGGEEESDLVRLRADQPRELSAGPRRSSVNISSSGIGVEALRSAKARAASATGRESARCRRSSGTGRFHERGNRGGRRADPPDHWSDSAGPLAEALPLRTRLR